MPIHDWSRVAAGTWHSFRFSWTAAIMDQLNSGLLPDGCFAMAEQVVSGPEPDVVTLKGNDFGVPFADSPEPVALADRTAPSTSVVMQLSDADRYAAKTNRINVCRRLGEVLAVIELVSPGNKNSRHAITSFVEKLVSLVRSDINLLVVDPFPPGPRDENGLHALIWSELGGDEFTLPAERLLTMASYQTQPSRTAWVEPTKLGSKLPTMPLFLRGNAFVNLPLEPSYAETWNHLPRELQKVVLQS